MKTNILLFVLYGIVISFIACKKDVTFVSDNTATINIINGVVNSPVAIKMNGLINKSGGTSGSSSQASLNFGSSAFFYAEAKSVPIQILKLPDSSSLVSNTFDLKKGGIYTLLLAGIVPNVEGIIIDDTNLPFVNFSTVPSIADSIINIRFINLAPNVQPLDIKITGTGTNEVTGLAFKAYSPFKSYTAKSTNGSYQFQIIENGIVLLTQTLSITTTNRFRDVALVIRGLKAGSPGLSVSTVNYFQ